MVWVLPFCSEGYGVIFPKSTSNLGRAEHNTEHQIIYLEMRGYSLCEQGTKASSLLAPLHLPEKSRDLPFSHHITQKHHLTLPCASTHDMGQKPQTFPSRHA